MSLVINLLVLFLGLGLWIGWFWYGKEKSKTDSSLHEDAFESLRLMTQLQHQSLEATKKELTDRLNEIYRYQQEDVAKLDEEVRHQLQKKIHQQLQSFSWEMQNRFENVNLQLTQLKPLNQSLNIIESRLTNPHQRGVWGEWQLEALLSQVLSPLQYEKNVSLNSQTQERVDFAVRISHPRQERWLPIDAKFPLVEDDDQDDLALQKRLFAEAKKISEKYLNPPVTTDFVCLFLPLESLYQRALKAPNLMQNLQSKYKVFLVGPSNLGALLSCLNSLLVDLPFDFNSETFTKKFREIPPAFENLCEQLEQLERYQRLWGKAFLKAKKQTEWLQNHLVSLESERGQFSQINLKTSKEGSALSSLIDG
jgi:DNA recombination protein RmuC